MIAPGTQVQARYVTMRPVLRPEPSELMPTASFHTFRRGLVIASVPGPTDVAPPALLSGNDWVMVLDSDSMRFGWVKERELAWLTPEGMMYFT